MAGEVGEFLAGSEFGVATQADLLGRSFHFEEIVGGFFIRMGAAEGIDNIPGEVGGKDGFEANFGDILVMACLADRGVGVRIALEGAEAFGAKAAFFVFGFSADATRASIEEGVGDFLDFPFRDESDEFEEFAQRGVMRKGAGDGSAESLGEDVVGAAINSIEGSVGRINPNAIAGEGDGKGGGFIAVDAEMFDRFEDRRMVDDEQIDAAENGFIMEGG